MVEIKDGYLYKMNEETGEIVSLACELYFFLHKEDVPEVMVDIPGVDEMFRSSQVPSAEYRIYYGFVNGCRCQLLWCFERDDEKAYRLFKQHQIEDIERCKEWLAGSEEILKRIYGAHEYSDSR